MIIPIDILLKLVHTVIFINVKPDPINPFFLGVDQRYNHMFDSIWLISLGFVKTDEVRFWLQKIKETCRLIHTTAEPDQTKPTH